SCVAHSGRPSFPTRRSSDLLLVATAGELDGVGDRHDLVDVEVTGPAEHAVIDGDLAGRCCHVTGVGGVVEHRAQVVDDRHALDRGGPVVRDGQRVGDQVTVLDVRAGSRHGVLGVGEPAVDVLGLAAALLLALTARVVGGHHVGQRAVAATGHGHRVGD